MSTMNTSNHILSKSERNEYFKPYIVKHVHAMNTSNHTLSKDVRNEYFKPYIVKE